MRKRSKRYNEVRKEVDREKVYPLDEAVSLLKKIADKKCKFDESVDISINLGVDPKQSDQSVRGAVVLPAGSGKNIRVLVFAKDEKADEAKQAQADYVGAEELIEKIKGGWLEFDTVIAVPQMMSSVGKLGKILGRKGLMPNPKTGTVTMDVANAVSDAKKGKAEFKLEKKGALLQASVGRMSFSEDSIKENLRALMEAVIKAKPSSAKGTYLKKLTISSTMSPGIRLDPSAFLTVGK
ncbi:MAG: 50S ribosomal protein L1 [Pseudomonadota bacterium]